MDRRTHQKGQAVTLVCIVTLFIFSLLIIKMSEVYKLANNHILKTEHHIFWEK